MKKTFIFTLSFCVLIFVNSFAMENIHINPSSYEEAYEMAYSLINTDANSALKVIKNIYNKNIPVTKQDTFYVRSIAALALRPIFKENRIGKSLLEKVVAVDKSDYSSNSILLSLFASENNFIDTRKYALNLLDVNYIEYLNSMKPASKSNLPEIRNYMNGIINMYQLISDFFMQNDDKENSKKALSIVRNLKNMQKNN